VHISYRPQKSKQEELWWPALEVITLQSLVTSKFSFKECFRQLTISHNIPVGTHSHNAK